MTILNGRVVDWDAVPLLMTARDLRELFGFSRDVSYRVLHRLGRRMMGRKMYVRKEAFQEWLQRGEQAA